jgi:hypothetical protein
MVPTWSSEAWLRLSDVGGVAVAGGGGGGDTVHPARVTTTDVDPSPTFALQVLDLKPEAPNLNSPFLSALPVAVDSGEETVIVAFDRAPLPSTARFPELREAFTTLTAATAADGVTNMAETTSSATSHATLRTRENRLLEPFIPSSDALRRVVRRSCGLAI